MECQVLIYLNNIQAYSPTFTSRIVNVYLHVHAVILSRLSRNLWWSLGLCKVLFYSNQLIKNDIRQFKSSYNFSVSTKSHHFRSQVRLLKFTDSNASQQTSTIKEQTHPCGSPKSSPTSLSRFELKDYFVSLRLVVQITKVHGKKFSQYLL